MTDNRFLSPIFLLFARRLANTPPFPADQDGIKFNFALQRWELSPFGGAGEANTSSNVGAGLGWALPKVGVDLPFKSFIAISPLSIVSNPNDITISISGAVNTFILGVYHDQAFANNSIEHIGVFSNDPTTAEARTTSFLAFTFTVIRYTLRINENSKNQNTTFSFRDDGADVSGTSIVVAGGVTGSFDSGALSVVVSANSLINFRIDVGAGGGTISDVGQMIEAEK